MIGLRFLFALIAISTLSSTALAETVQPPAELSVPADCKLLCEFDAKGVQIYKGTEGTDGKLAWVLEAPLANLSTNGKTVGWHFEGPTWVAADGSSAKKIDGKDAVAKVPAPNAQTDIPWLRIAIKGDEGKAGQLSKAQFVLRLNTKGGQPPAEPPVRAGVKIGIDYIATYSFYGK